MSSGAQFGQVVLPAAGYSPIGVAVQVAGNGEIAVKARLSGVATVAAA